MTASVSNEPEGPHGLLLTGVAAAVHALVVGALGALIGWLAGSWWVGALLGAIIGATGTVVAVQRRLDLLLRAGRARDPEPGEFPHYTNLVEGLAATWGVGDPRVAVVDDRSPNGFVAAGPGGESAVVLTTGLLRRLERIELEGVVSHAVGRIRNGDADFGSTLATSVGLPVLLGDLALRQMWTSPHRRLGTSDQPNPRGLIALLGAPLLALSPITMGAIRRFVSPFGPSMADQAAVQATRYPPGLAAALEKLTDPDSSVRSATRATAHLWFSRPLEEDEGPVTGLSRVVTASHPPIEERIAALREL